MSMKMKQTVYESPKQILAISDHYVAFAYRHAKADSTTPGLAILRDGRYIIPAGTIYPANDASAVGIVLSEYDVTDGDAILTVVTHGFIKTAALPAVPSANAISALKQIAFLPYVGMGITLTCTKAAIEVGATADPDAVVLNITNGTFRPEASTLTNWTITGESTTKLTVTSITVANDGKSVTIALDQTAAAVAGDVTVLPAVSIVSTGMAAPAAVTIATVA